MTKKAIIDYVCNNEVLSDLSGNFDFVSIGHVQMVERVGKALLGHPGNFNKIIKSVDNAGDLVITLPHGSWTPNTKG
jgi:hypothetical protein